MRRPGVRVIQGLPASAGRAGKRYIADLAARAPIAERAHDAVIHLARGHSARPALGDSAVGDADVEAELAIRPSRMRDGTPRSLSASHLSHDVAFTPFAVGVYWQPGVRSPPVGYLNTGAAVARKRIAERGGRYER